MDQCPNQVIEEPSTFVCAGYVSRII